MTEDNFYDVLVYQPGKVGSVSVTRALEEAGYNPVSVHRIVNVHGEFNTALGIKKAHKFLANNDKPLKIVVLVRDLIARNLSAFFWNFQDYYRYPTYTINNVKTCFMNNYPQWIPEVWFYEELYSLTGLDIADMSFSKRTNSGVLENEDFQVLVMTTESLSTTGGKVLGRFMGFGTIDIAHLNVNTVPQYVNVKEQMRFPANFIDRLYGTWYMKKFYSANKIDEFRNKWLLVEED